MAPFILIFLPGTDGESCLSACDVPEVTEETLCLLLREGRGAGAPTRTTEPLKGVWFQPQHQALGDATADSPIPPGLGSPCWPGSHQVLGGLGAPRRAGLGWGGAEGCGGSDLPSKHVSALHLSQCHAGSCSSPPSVSLPDPVPKLHLEMRFRSQPWQAEEPQEILNPCLPMKIS